MKFSDLVVRSWENLLVDKGRTSLTIFSAAIGALSIIIMISIGGELKNEVIDNFINSSDIYTITVTEQYDEKNSNILDEFRKLNGVKGVYLSGVVEYVGDVSMLSDKINCTLIAVDEETLKTMDDYIGKGNVINDTNGVIISKNIGDRYDVINKNGTIDVKDISNSENIIAIPIKVDGVLNSDEPFLANNIYKNTDGTYPYLMYISMERIDMLNNESIYVKTRNYKIKAFDAKSVESIGNYLKDNKYQYSSVYERANSIANIFMVLQGILGMLGGITLIVASISTANTMSMSILERKKEIGILKAIGMKTTHIKNLFIIEASYIGVIGGALGILLSFPASLIINYIFRNNIPASAFSMEKIIDISVSSMVGVLFITIVLMVVASISTVKKAASLEILTALREE